MHPKPNPKKSRLKRFAAWLERLAGLLSKGVHLISIVLMLRRCFDQLWWLFSNLS